MDTEPGMHPATCGHSQELTQPGMGTARKGHRARNAGHRARNAGHRASKGHRASTTTTCCTKVVLPPKQRPRSQLHGFCAVIAVTDWSMHQNINPVFARARPPSTRALISWPQRDVLQPADGPSQSPDSIQTAISSTTKCPLAGSVLHDSRANNVFYGLTAFITPSIYTSCINLSPPVRSLILASITNSP